MALPLIPQDKANHAVYGAMFAVVVLAVVVFAGLHVNLRVIPLLAALVIGVAKELYDSMTGGDVSAMDVLATFCGGVLVSVSGELVKG